MEPALTVSLEVRGGGRGKFQPRYDVLTFPRFKDVFLKSPSLKKKGFFDAGSDDDEKTNRTDILLR